MKRVNINEPAVIPECSAGLEKANCQWLKAGHILEMSGKILNRPNQKKMAGRVQQMFFLFYLLTTTPILII